MFRGFTFALRPNTDQAAAFDRTVGVCRLIWNLALEQRVNHWRQYQRATGDNLNYVTQARQLKDLRAEFDWIKEVSQTVQQRALKDLDTAFTRFFKGQGGFPKFKRKSGSSGFSYSGRDCSIERINKRWARIKLPKMGWIRFRITRDIIGSMREVSISRTAIGWQVSIGCVSEDVPGCIGGSVGVDRGVSVPLMLSDHSSFNLPVQIGVLEQRCKAAQRAASRKTRGSVRWQKTVRRVAKLRAKQARVRKHWAHEATTAICKKYGTVVIERLRTQNMTRRAKLKGVSQKRGLNRAILNVGWHQIEAMFSYKAFELKKVDAAYTSQTCSCCGAVDKRARESQASFVCLACGFRGNADWNAAINILNRGITPGIEAVNRGAVEVRTVQGI